MATRFYYPPNYDNAVTHICSENLYNYTIHGLVVIRCKVCNNMINQHLENFNGY